MNCKSILITTVLFFMFFNGWSQQRINSDSLIYYIKNLGWHSFSLTPTYVRSVVLNDDAISIINNTTDSNRVAALLMNEIGNEDKVVAVHIILTKLFEPQHNRFRESYKYSGDSIIAINFTYNNLTWQFESKTCELKVQPEEINRIKDYWRNKLKLVLDARRLHKKSG